MFSFPPQVLGVAKVLAHKMHVGRGYKLKVQIHAPTSGGTL